MDQKARELKPGLWRWTAPHPEWTPAKAGPGGWEEWVGCIYYEAPGHVVLIDPLAPPAATPEHETFWKALDRDVQRAGLPVAVLLANHYHERSAQAVLDRYKNEPGASLWAHEAARDRVSCRLTHTFLEGDTLPGEIRAFSLPALNQGEVALYIPAHGALIVADALIGAGDEKLRICPASWAEGGNEGQERFKREFRPSLRRLLDLPIEMVLVSHGPPVLSGGRPALEAALESPEWGA